MVPCASAEKTKGDARVDVVGKARRVAMVVAVTLMTRTLVTRVSTLVDSCWGRAVLRVTQKSVIYPSFIFLISNPTKLSSTKLGLGRIASLVSS